ncbi:hypothetical protein AB0K05_30095 [Nonomuraea sp. NPDC049486]|uniref:hypothetical protein n=1 Tax=Nonomuraea sp. NPDC049486 TaxID=3155773 RepID=UPI0034352B4A
MSVRHVPPAAPPTTLAACSYLAAPLLALVYGVLRIVDGFDGSRGPGAAWTLGHLAFMAALVLFAVMLHDMRALLGRTRMATVTFAAGLAGIGFAFVQFAVDVVVGFMAADHEAMGPLFDQVQAVPGVSLLVYQAGPVLFYAALVALSAQLAAGRHVRPWMPLLVLAQTVLPVISLDLIPVGSVLAVVAFLPLALRARSRSVPAHV